MSLAATAMRGCALKWWRWWSPLHPDVSWDDFTTSFLWRFKPEYRPILPLFDEEEEPDQESPPLMELNESMNEVLKAWDTFLLSEEQIEVPQVLVPDLTVATVTPTGGFQVEVVDLPDATMQKLINTPKLLGGSKTAVETHFANSFHVEPLILDGFAHLPDLTYSGVDNPPPPPKPPDRVVFQTPLLLLKTPCRSIQKVTVGLKLTRELTMLLPPPKPPDQVEIAIVRNLNSYADGLGIWLVPELTLRPPAKPPDLESLVEPNVWITSANGICPVTGFAIFDVIVIENDKHLYDNSIVMEVSFIECLIIEFVSPIVVIISGCECSGVIVNIINVLYTKQGGTNNAFNIFDILPTQTIVTSAGLMNGSARICMHKLASGLFEEMVQLGNHNAYSTYEHMDVENFVFVKMPLAINCTCHTLNHSLIVMQCHVSLIHADFDTSGTLERVKFLLNEKLGMVTFDFQFVELMAWLIIIDDGSTYSGLVLRRLVDKCTWLLGSKFMLSVYLHSVDVGRIVQNLLGRFTVLGSDQSLGYNLCTPMLVATILTTCSTHIFSHHVLEAPAKCFIECLELNCININILIDPFLGIASLVVVQKLKRVNEKGILKVISQHKVLFTSVHQNVTCRICCYYDFGSNALVLFEYPAHSALEIHLPQCTRNCLDMDCFSNLTFAEETTSFVAFLRYVHSSPIWCHDIKFSCILAKDDFSAIIARLGLLYGVVTSNLQWYLNCQCMHFCKTSICNMHVMLLGILLLVPNSQVPYSELIFGPCGYNLNGRWFGVTQVLAYQAWHAKLSLVQVQVLASAGHPKTWDPGGGDYFFHTKGSLQFKQWDPGGNF